MHVLVQHAMTGAGKRPRLCWHASVLLAVMGDLDGVGKCAVGRVGEHAEAGLCICLCHWPSAQLPPLEALGHVHKRKNKLNVTLDPGGHQPQHPYAHGRTHAKQEQAGVPGKQQERTAGGASTSGWRSQQEGGGCANTDAVGGWRVHTADDTPSRTRSQHRNFTAPQALTAQGSSRVRQERDKTRRGNNIGHMPERKRRKQHRPPEPQVTALGVPRHSPRWHVSAAGARGRAAR